MRSSRLLALCALAYGAAVFLPMLANSFYRDDFGWVERAIAVAGDPAGWFFIAKTDFRPLASLSFVVNAALSGIDPAGYYAFNLILHLGNVALVMALARRLSGGDGRAAAIAGLLFAGAVGNYGEAILWISGRTGMIADLFMLASLVAHWDWRERGRGRDRALSLACFALALLAKESASVLLVLLVALDGVHAAGGARSAGPRRAVAYAPHAAMLAAYLVFQFASWRSGSPILVGEWRLGFHAAANLGEYLARMFVPVSPTSMFIALPPSFGPALEALYAALRILLPFALAGLLLSRRVPRPVKFALVWIPLTLLPVVFFTYRTSTRYLYAPSIGLALVLGLVGAAWWGRRAAESATSRLRAAAAGLVVLLAVQAAVVQVIIRRHAALERSEGAEEWARLRAIARGEQPASREAP
jgi:protein O-mannosyl-transferase